MRMTKRREPVAGTSRRRAIFPFIRDFRSLLFKSFIGFLILSSGTALGFDVALKVSCGVSLMRFNEINGNLDGWTEFRKKEAASTSGWTFDGGKVRAFKQGFDFEGEILFIFSRRLALSVGSGYSYTEITEGQAELTVSKSGVPYLYCRPTKVSAHPLIISAYHYLPLGRALQVYIKGGAGLLWAKYVDRIFLRESGVYTKLKPREALEQMEKELNGMLAQSGKRER